MEKRVLLAVFMSFLVLMAYQTFVVKPRMRDAAQRQPPPQDVSRTTPAAGAASGADAAAARPDVNAPVEAGTVKSGTVGSAPGQPAAVQTAPPAISERDERDIVVETPHVSAVFSNRGATIKRWRLKHYLDSGGQPIDILPVVVRDPALKPFAVTIAEPADTAALNTALYRASTDRLDLTDRPGTLTFDYQDANGLAVRKTFEVQPDGLLYSIHATITVSRNGMAVPVTVHGGAGVGDLERGVVSSGFLAVSTYQPPGAISMLGSDVVRTPATSLGPQEVREGRFRFAGVDDHYFLSTMLPGDRQTRVEYRAINVDTPFGPRNLADYRVRVAGGASKLNFFYGPKDFDVLQAVDRELVRTIHFGWFDLLATPLLKSLKWINAFVGNYGWSIIILTIFINLLMFPLRHKSVVSMRKMQEIQPQVKAIQDRYSKLKATDPQKQKMNAELMNLYREKGVNPASGCVPMLLTMPVLFAFYALLSVAIELRGAPFMWWIRDLSTFDPLYITPVLMGATQFWQTKMTPMTTADPVQQRMMMMMPVIFLVFFLWMPAGLVLYWLVSNMWTIGQQYVTNYLIGPPPQHTVRPVAERRVKKPAPAGGGASDAR